METFRKIAVGDKLKAIDVCLMNTEREALIIGKEYEVRERGKDEEGEYILIYSEIGEHTFNVADLLEFFDVEPTPSRESELAELQGVLVGLRICKELWAQGTISHETIRENEVYYEEQIETLLKK